MIPRSPTSVRLCREVFAKVLEPLDEIGTANRLSRDSRGISEVMGYLIALGIITFVVGSIGFMGSQFLLDIREQHLSTDVEPIGHQTVSRLQSVDISTRSSTTDPYAAISQHVGLPAKIAGGQQYRISVDMVAGPPDHTWNSDRTALDTAEWGKYRITVTTEEGLTSSVYMTSLSQIKETSVQGGAIRIVRPQPTQGNVDSGRCVLYETNGQSGLQTSGDASGEDEYPDTCQIILVSAVGS